mmetsp:Transcript_49526/g.50325  ORF Transcript_49526/g.50325 Transcript_49526/m.50325 type:complete len:125 (+) Transcript_49526:262-636(+)
MRAHNDKFGGGWTISFRRTIDSRRTNDVSQSWENFCHSIDLLLCITELRTSSRAPCCIEPFSEPPVHHRHQPPPSINITQRSTHAPPTRFVHNPICLLFHHWNWNVKEKGGEKKQQQQLHTEEE